MSDPREKILVIRLSSLGDVLLASPTLRALRKRFPESHIDLLVTESYADAASLLPGPDRILTLRRGAGIRDLLSLRSTLSGRYSLLVDLQNSFRSAFLRTTTFSAVWVKAQRYRCRRWLLVRFHWNTFREILPVPLRYLQALSMVGGSDDGGGLELSVPAEKLAWAENYIEESDKKFWIALCPGSRHFTKQWPPERWIELGRELGREGYFVLVVGASQEADLIKSISSAIPDSRPVFENSIPEIAALFTRMEAVVSNDSGLMHLAAGVETPVVAIFGPTVEEFGFYPFRARSEILSHQLNCRPCSAMGGEVCPKKHFRCMLNTQPSDALAAVKRILPKARDSQSV